MVKTLHSSLSDVRQFLGRLVPGTQCDYKLDNCSQRFASLLLSLVVIPNLVLVLVCILKLSQ